jgi:hypothetical protein
MVTITIRSATLERLKMFSDFGDDHDEILNKLMDNAEADRLLAIYKN